MLKRFPHTLTYTSKGIDSGWDQETGLPIPSIPGEEISIKCRAEDNVRSNYIINEVDGSRVEFSFVIHFDKSSNSIPTGIQVQVMNDQEIKASGIVKRFHKGQLHNRIWI